MYRFTLLICTFVLCINWSECAPSSSSASLLAALLSSQQQNGATREKSSETGLTTYDQKQTGKYNIHLNIKDVAIIALDAGRLDSGVGDFGEDYYEDYDLSDFTVKPIFGLIDIASDKPSSSSSTTEAPPLIHFESDEDFLAANNKTESNSTSIEEPIIKDPVNKTQSVIILSSNTTSSVTILPNDGSNSSGIVVTTPTPAPEDLPPKLSLSDLANIYSASPANFPIKPNEIPVQIILEQIQGDKESSRQRPHTNFSPNGNWRLRNRIRATPSANRRITPPHDVYPSNPSIGNNKQRKSSNIHANRRNCVHDQTGQCQNSNRRFSSPTL